MKTENLNTDELFNALPMFINVDGKLYFFHLIKGQNGVIVEYKMNESEEGHNLGNTRRRGKSLNDALKQMLDWLIEFNYLDKVERNILSDMLQNIKN